MPDRHANVLHALGLLVLTLAGNRISAITRFDNSVPSYFGLPQTCRSDMIRSNKKGINRNLAYRHSPQ